MNKLKTVDGIIEAVGDTPLVRLNRVVPENGVQLYGKLEARNKDRHFKIDGKVVNFIAKFDIDEGTTQLSLQLTGYSLDSPLRKQARSRDPRS